MDKQQLRDRCRRILANLTHDENAAANAGDALADLFDELAGESIEPVPPAPPVAYDPDADFERVHVVPSKTRGQQVAEGLFSVVDYRDPDAGRVSPMIRLEHEAGAAFFWFGEPSETPGYHAAVVRRIRESVAAAIDLERQAAARQEREACASVIDDAAKAASKEGDGKRKQEYEFRATLIRSRGMGDSIDPALDTK